MDNWDEIRTAYQVARVGTVSGAAEVLGVHHATVIRHVDALEARLGAKLFQRHARGYTATEAGQELLKVAQATDDQFAHLAARIAGTTTDISGELVVTSVSTLTELVSPTLARLQAEYPELTVRYVTDPRVFRLEYGEAHVAIRAGGRPQEPDNVVQSLCTYRAGLYAAPAYLERHGVPADETALAGHRFVGPVDPETRAPFFRWLVAAVPSGAIVFRTNEPAATAEAILAGTAMGFLPVLRARRHPDLVEVLPPREEWDTPLWLVTHVDLHRTPRIQAFLAALKDDARGCGLT
ncbi:MAG: LysR family transcriptional regulator [Defluviimonas sp.]|uniref:LysR family transcriptional regulator n=1 Tax=Albidovulum sp. TaxID=1872424 RepID=UPI001D23F71D|nr:LysR family transcriptional regulator [Paracoccaceae bacterium]MCC0065171.1 LysR family transcriptional regulator [Defluviimonas sp.]